MTTDPLEPPEETTPVPSAPPPAPAPRDAVDGARFAPLEDDPMADALLGVAEVVAVVQEYGAVVERLESEPIPGASRTLGRAIRVITVAERDLEVELGRLVEASGDEDAAAAWRAGADRAARTAVGMDLFKRLWMAEATSDGDSHPRHGDDEGHGVGGGGDPPDDRDDGAGDDVGRAGGGDAPAAPPVSQ